ncbi:MAG: hypothetical protein ABIL09_07785, partial [Gemmatimonadota bacterium]
PVTLHPRAAPRPHPGIRPAPALRLLLIAALAALATGLSGCAAYYAADMGRPLKRLARGDYEGALAKLEKPSGDTNKLLYRLERGLILHYQGAYEESNAEFERAEKLVDRFYTRSVSREVVSLLTNDAVRPYSGEEFERALIHYYRALNYWKLGDPEGALVECRKANLRLAQFAAAADYALSYRNDAFLQYMTGLLYEAEGEWNDAYISFKDAAKGYAAYEEAFGLRTPRPLAQDLVEVAARLGYQDEVAQLAEQYGVPRPGYGAGQTTQVVVFAESGFIARKGQEDINLPIMEDGRDRDAWMVSERAVYRYRHPAYGGRVKYWLRVALPVYEPVRSAVTAVRVSAGTDTARAVLAEDLDAIAARTLQEKEDTILLRTVARGIAKYAATKAAEKKSDFLGVLVNLLGAGTEAADTRGWLSLPKAIWLGRLNLPPGTTDVVVEFLDGAGRVVDVQRFGGVEMAPGRTVFLSYRSFR